MGCFLRSCSGRIIDASIGVRVNDMIKENIVAYTTVRLNCLKMDPAMLDMVARGRNTMRLVSVEARTATVISAVPCDALSLRSSPMDLCRKIFSSTTMELVTRIPTEVESPMRLRIFSENPESFMKRNVEMMDMGMESATIIVDRIS